MALGTTEMASRELVIWGLWGARAVGGFIYAYREADHGKEQPRLQ